MLTSFNQIYMSCYAGLGSLCTLPNSIRYSCCAPIKATLESCGVFQSEGFRDRSLYLFYSTINESKIGNYPSVRYTVFWRLLSWVRLCPFWFDLELSFVFSDICILSHHNHLNTESYFIMSSRV